METFEGISVDSSVTVSGEFLTSDVAVRNSNSNFTINSEQLPATDVLAGTQFVITYNGTAISDSTIITFTSGTATATLKVYGTAAVPVLSVSPSTLIMETFEGISVDSSVTVSGEFLISDVAVKNNNSNFTINSEQLPAADVLASTQFVITYNGTAISDSTIITFTSGSATATLKVYGTATISIPHIVSPVISVQPPSVSVETIRGAAVISSVVVTGEFLTSDVSVVSNNDNFAIYPELFPVDDVLEGTQLTVMFNCFDASDSAVITFTSDTAAATFTIYIAVTFATDVLDGLNIPRTIVYPNPSDGHFTVSAANGTRYEVIAMRGRVIVNGVIGSGFAASGFGNSGNSEQLYIRNSGIYMLRLIDNSGKVATQRVVVR
jgi:hypothetical protein